MSTITARPVEVGQPKVPVRGIATVLVAAIVLVAALVLSQQSVTPEAPASAVGVTAADVWAEVTAVPSEPVVSSGSQVVDQALVQGQASTPSAAQQAESARLAGLAAHHGTNGQEAYSARLQAQADAYRTAASQQAYNEAEIAGLVALGD